MHSKNCCRFPMRAAIRLSTNQRMLWLVAMNRSRTTQAKRCAASSSKSLTTMCSFYQNNPLYQALLFYKEEEKAIYEDGAFPEFRFVRWHDAGVDVLPNPGSKAQTALWMAKHLGFAHEDTIAFGDGNNDYELISSVGYGVAMGNAGRFRQGCRQICHERL